MNIFKSFIYAAVACFFFGSSLSGQGLSFAHPRDNPKNFTISIGAARMDIKDSNLDVHYGTTIAGAWRISHTSKLQLDVSFLRSDSDSYGWKIKDTVIPVILSYDFCIPFGSREQFEFRISPALGATLNKYRESVYSYYYSDYYSDSEWLFSYGIGAGFTWHIGKKFFIDAGYRYLRMADSELQDDDAVTHTLALSVGYKF